MSACNKAGSQASVDDLNTSVSAATTSAGSPPAAARSRSGRRCQPRQVEQFAKPLPAIGRVGRDHDPAVGCLKAWLGAEYGAALPERTGSRHRPSSW